MFEYAHVLKVILMYLSHMFRDVDIPFLRYLSQFFTSEYYMPGDIIYKTLDLKTKMIYVVGGVIQVLSEEDDETPIISFTTGTCIGEITLTLSYPSTTVLKSATYTELYILERSSYCSEMRNYPNHLRRIFKNVLKRFEIARELVAIRKTIKSQTMIDAHDQTTLSWIKNSLRNFQWEAHNERKLIKSKREKRRELENDFSIYNEIQHKAIYLDLYNITEQTSEFDSQRVCLTGNFPWILKPESPFLKVWDRIILCDILITTAIIPYNAVYLMNMTIAAVVLMFSSLYICDIYIQMTTAFLTRDGLVTSLRPLLYLKFMNVPFLVDFVGSFPLELVIYLLNENGDIAASFVFLQINRILRIWKFEQFFNALENTLYSKVWHFRILKYTFYVILAIYFYGCVLFKETCPT
ncbi:hypothetical protein C0J52_15296 [Blattella germanica]|nr:hypothetical protein C0J52_15296 [Blattella germanica]